METYLIVMIIMLSLIFIGVLIFKWIKWLDYRSKRQDVSDYCDEIVNNKKIFTPSEFFEMYKDLKIYNYSVTDKDSSGIYIIYNMSKKLPYIGQSINVIKRINNHFTGKGNGDVYADFKYGDVFEITIISCKQERMNVLESEFIKKYDSCTNGYNKNNGSTSTIF